VAEDILMNPFLITLGILIPLFPLAGFLVNGLFGRHLPGKSAGVLATLAVFASFACSFLIFLELDAGAQIKIGLFDWIAFGNLNIGFNLLIDPLTVTMLLVITGIGFLIHLYSIGYMHGDDGFSRFFTYLNLFLFFMLLLVMGSNYLVMFIGWEGVGLCSYLLIGFWFKNDAYNDAAKKAFIMNRIGDLGFLLGMFFILFHFGSLEYGIVAGQAAAMPSGSTVLTIITCLLFVGAMGKSAQLPLYTWLPDAMAGPTPVSALIHAATMVTAGIYMIVRSNVLFALAPETLSFVLCIGVITCVFAAVIGLMQNDIKKVLAYSTVSQLGLMFAALGLGAFGSGMFHVVTHAFFKALLFLGSGSVIHALHGEQDIRKMGGLKKYLPVTYITFLIASLAISGFPLLSGFFSKDEILAHAFQQNRLIWGVLSVSSMLTAFYMFRLVYLTFYGNFRGSEESRKKIHESPASMSIPLVILCIFSAVGGILGLPHVFHVSHLLNDYLSSVISPSAQFLPAHHAISAQTEVLLMSFAGIAAIAAILFARYKYVSKAALPAADEKTLSPLQRLVSNKFYVDEFYTALFVKPVKALSELLFVFVDKLVIDLVVSSTAWILGFTGRTLRLIQNGNTGFYVFAMVFGMIVLFIITLIVK
jgi:NADH-quinone oxidoreductase subunit L